MNWSYLAAAGIALVAALLPALVQAMPAQQGTDERGLFGPILVLVVIVLLNIAVLAVAFRLRQVFRQIGGEDEDQPAPNE